MKNSTLAGRSFRCILLLAALCAGAITVMAQAANRADISALLSAHDDALSQQNLDALLALYAPGDKTVMLGTGPGERYQGKDQIRAAYTEIFKDFDKGSQTHECYWKDGAASKDMAWLAAMCKFTDAHGDKKRDYELNVSAVAQRLGGKWQFVMVHYSNVVSGAAPASPSQ